MKIEHITLGGNLVIRDSSEIAPEVIELLKPFQIFGKSVKLPFPHTAFIVKATAVDEGAVFNIFKNDKLAFTNICCFHSEQNRKMLALVNSFHTEKTHGDTRRPVYPNWIYSVPVLTSHLDLEELKTVDEIELRIYNALHIARPEQ